MTLKPEGTEEEGVLQLARGTKFLWEFIFVDWRFFVFLQELIFAIKTD